MTTVTDIGSLIVSTPGICGGRPRIAGTGVSVRRIVAWDRCGLSPADIILQVPHLTLGQVHAALAHYYANRESMDADMAAEDAEAERLESEGRHPGRPS